MVVLFWGMVVLFGGYGCVILGYGCVIFGGMAVLFWGMVVLFGGYGCVILRYGCVIWGVWLCYLGGMAVLFWQGCPYSALAWRCVALLMWLHNLPYYKYLDAAAFINSDPQRVSGGGTGRFWFIIYM